jgi:hypothetical protein
MINKRDEEFALTIENLNAHSMRIANILRECVCILFVATFSLLLGFGVTQELFSHSSSSTSDPATTGTRIWPLVGSASKQPATIKSQLSLPHITSPVGATAALVKERQARPPQKPPSPTAEGTSLRSRGTLPTTFSIALEPEFSYERIHVLTMASHFAVGLCNFLETAVVLGYLNINKIATSALAEALLFSDAQTPTFPPSPPICRYNVSIMGYVGKPTGQKIMVDAKIDYIEQFARMIPEDATMAWFDGFDTLLQVVFVTTRSVITFFLRFFHFIPLFFPFFL